MSTPTPRARNSGFTLVEVAIALAIFVFGALAIVQIFPPALGVIRNNESRVMATQLGEATLARFRDKTSPAPEAIFDIAETSTEPYLWNDYDGAVVGTVNKNGSLPKSPEASDFATSALGHFRYIYSEPHFVGPGQLPLLNRPIDSSWHTPARPVISTYERIIEGVQIKEDGFLDFTHAYMVNGTPFNTPYNLKTTPFNDGVTRPSTGIQLPPTGYRSKFSEPEETKGATYYVSYRWREASTPNIIRGVLEEPLRIPDDVDLTGNSARVLPCVIGTANKAIPGAVSVRMRATVPVTVSSAGTISLGGLSDTFYISYLSRDWREMTDESAPVDNTVKLPISGIEENSVSGLLTNSNRTTVIASGTVHPIASVDYKRGFVTYTFPVTSGARIRTNYRTLDGWAQQTSVAPRTYIPYHAGERNNPHFPREPWREYAWSANDPTNIYFHASEAGKTVSVSIDNGTTTLNSTITIRDIENTPTATWWGTNFGGFATSGKIARATITGTDGNPVTTTTAILSVQGLSIHARTAWQNADRYNQVIVPAYRTLMQ